MYKNWKISYLDLQIRVSEQSISVKEMLINIVLITSCLDILFFTLMMTWGLRNCFVICMYVCMYVCMYTSWHHIKFLVKYAYLSILVIRNVTVICMYVYKLAPHKFFGWNMLI